MRSESGFRIAPDWPKIEKMKMTSQFADITLSQFLLLFCFSRPVYLLVQVLC